MLVLVMLNVILLVAVIVLLMRPEPEFPETRPRCPDCGAKFRKLEGLLMHMKATHPINFNSEKSVILPKDSPYRGVSSR